MFTPSDTAARFSLSFSMLQSLNWLSILSPFIFWHVSSGLLPLCRQVLWIMHSTVHTYPYPFPMSCSIYFLYYSICGNFYFPFLSLPILRLTLSHNSLGILLFPFLFEKFGWSQYGVRGLLYASMTSLFTGEWWLQWGLIRLYISMNINTVLISITIFTVHELLGIYHWQIRPRTDPNQTISRLQKSKNIASFLKKIHRGLVIVPTWWRLRKKNQIDAVWVACVKKFPSERETEKEKKKIKKKRGKQRAANADASNLKPCPFRVGSMMKTA